MVEVIELYEYGNGVYAKPFWDRVQEKIDKVTEKYEIVDMIKKFIPAHYVGKNCMGMDTYKGDELFLTLFCKKKAHIYHLVRNVQFSKNTSVEMKKLCQLKSIIKKANEFHRVQECGEIKIEGGAE